MIHYAQCPLCGSADIHPVFEARDHTVSGNVFAIWQCQGCTARFTQDVPDINAIGPYYLSDKYISHSDTREGLVNRLYHRIRTVTLRSKRRLINRQSRKRTGRLLDVGCGTGAFLHAMQTAGWQVKGLEPDPGARERALQLYGLMVQPVDDFFSLPAASFDVITLWHVLEHVHDLKAYVAGFKRLLAPGGVLLIAVPNYTSYDAGHYGSFWAAYDVPRHLYHFSPASMQRLMEGVGLGVKKMKPMWFDSFYVSLLSERYRKGKEGPVGAVVTGTLSNIKALFNPSRCSSVIYIVN